MYPTRFQTAAVTDRHTSIASDRVHLRDQSRRTLLFAQVGDLTPVPHFHRLTRE